MKIKLIVVLMLVATAASEAQSIYDNYVSASWDYNMPLSNNSFINSSSSQGFQMGFRKKIERFYVGADFNYATYSEYKSRQTTFADNAATTTDIYNYIYNYGFTLNADYIFRPFKKLMPFVGMGIGANSISYSMFYNIYSSKDTGIGGLFRPQAGALLKLGKDSKVALTAVVHYDYSTASSSIFNYSSFSTFGFRLGFALNIPNTDQ
jgi:opacity protein-like surface antigen